MNLQEQNLTCDSGIIDELKPQLCQIVFDRYNSNRDHQHDPPICCIEYC